MNAAGHCPTKSAQSSLPTIFKMAEAAMAPNAAAKYPELGISEVCDSMAPVIRSSATPSSTLVSIYLSPAFIWTVPHCVDASLNKHVNCAGELGGRVKLNWRVNSPIRIILIRQCSFYSQNVNTLSSVAAAADLLYV